MKLTSIDPKAVHDFLSKVENGHSVIMVRGPQGLVLEVIEDKSKPETAISEEKVRRSDVLAVLKLMTALATNRPAKLAPDAKGYWKLYIGQVLK